MTIKREAKPRGEKVFTVIPMLTPEHPALSKLYLLVITNKRIMGIYGGGLLSGFDRVTTIFEALGSASVTAYPLTRGAISTPGSIPLDEPITGEEAEADMEELESIALSRKSNFIYNISEIEEIRVEPRRGTNTFHKLIIKAKGKTKKFLVSVKAIRSIEGVLKEALKDKIKIVS
ncbi:MAG: hypothetical protein ACXQTI_05130 [Candidatus Nezhaarchaeales archaeon]